MSSPFFKSSFQKEQTSPSLHPLSHGQQAFWLLYEMAPENPAYNLFITARIYSSLDIKAFHRTWERIVERHSILRTTYTSQAGVPVQQIHARRNPNIQVIDAAGWSEDYLREQIFAKADLPFNLKTDSIIRIYLFKQSLQENILLLTIHHIASDLWSAYVVLNDFQKFYLAEINQFSVEDEESPEDLSYIKFICWQNELLSSAKGERLLHYWQKQLAGELPVLALPTDRPRPLVKTERKDTYFLTLDQNLLQKLKEQALASGASLFKTLLATFYVLLYRYTCQEDILVGVPMLGRWGKAFKKSIGYFANPTVVRAAISDNLTFGELLSQVSDKLKEAQKHQDYPFPLLVKQFQSQRDLSRMPLFQVTFALQQERWYKPECNAEREGNFHLEPYYLKGQRGVTSDLDVVVLETEDLCQICWQYSTDLFDKTTITRMAGHFQTLLESIVANPNQSIAELPLLTEAERHQLLVEWNNTKTEYPKNKCIHQLFEAQVERTPDAVAVVFEGEQLTYQELNARANQLAHYLQTLGVGNEVLVGICVERSLEMIVGILGILKAGGAYVPLDPTYPRERLAFMLEDASLSVLLTEATLAKKFPQYSEHIFCLDTNWGEITQYSEEKLVSRVIPDNLAYVIYTSGSTGKPKGVAVPHKAVNRLVINTNYINLKPKDVVAQISNSSFDAATFEIWGALLNGAKLVVITKDIALSPQDFASQLSEQGITVLFLTTALFNLLASVVLSAFDSVQHLLFGGEVVDPKSVKKVLKNGSPQKLLHVYGPTESTTFTTWYLVQDVPQETTTIPIGRPIVNTQIYILGRHLEPVPIGVTGELYIGGDGLARGYLNHPGLSLEKFIPNPFNNEPESRLYKTGDLARYLPDGNIEYLGRIDNQVKIRGFRIELGEIEATLSQHSAVQQAMVVVREEVPGDKRLVAYCVTQPEIFSAQELRTFLKQRLPEYMVPADFVPMEALPLTPNGKVDRQALPALDRTRNQLENHFTAPRTPTEVCIAQIWAQVLGLQEVGIHDNFFELGGHSLLAIQIMSRIRETFDLDLPLSYLFEAPTITSLSQAITSAQETQTLDRAKMPPAIVPVPRNGAIPLSFPQNEIWYLEHNTAGVCAGNSPFALKVTGTVSPLVLEQSFIVLEQSFNEIIRRHEILRTAFSTVEEQPIQKSSPFLTVPLEVIALQHLPLKTREIEAQKILRQVMSHHLDLSVAPLIKIVLIQLSPQEHWLLILMHHIITDGWSYNILLEELTTLYDAFLAGKASPLPDLPFQYADFAIWQRNYFNEEVLATHLPYWQQHLADLPTSLDLLPAAKTSQDSSGDPTYNVGLPKDLTNAIASFSQSCGVTPFIVLLTALNILLWKWSDRTDILVLSTTTNRATPDLEKLIGCFISDLPLRIQLDLNQTGSSLLKQIKQMVSAALSHVISAEKIWEPVWDKIKVLRTVNLVLVPSMQWSSQTLTYNCNGSSIEIIFTVAASSG